MFQNILVVCVGNICRSPMGEYLFRERIAAAGRDVQVGSAGIGAMVGKGADPTALELMNERGIDMSPHRARQIDADIVRGAELILVMESWQQKELEGQFPSARGKVHRLGRWGDIEIGDPYRQTRAVFEIALEAIEQGIDEWEKRLWT